MSKNPKSGQPGDLAKLNASPQAAASWQQAQQNLLHGRNAAALAGYRSLVRQFPDVSQLWAEMGLAAAGDLDFTLADQASRRAAELAASDANLLVSLGQQYHRLRRLDQAAACFADAVKADPSSVHARLSLAAWLERSGKLDEAWVCVELCLAQNPKDSRALYYRSFLLHRKGMNAEAETALRELLKSNPPEADVKYSATHLLGVVLDALGQYDEALRSLAAAKSMLRHMTNTVALEESYDKMARARKELLAALTKENIQRWREEAPEEKECGRLVFLGGAPRSGTTLLEQILGAHPQILVFDEAEAFATEILNALCPPPPARGLSAKTLNSLTSTDRRRLRNRYLKSLKRGASDADASQLLLDKNPSLTASLHVWLRLFPKLKVIIALRDPRDVIVSCYFQNLTLTAANVNFLSLDRTAAFYADCMDVWLRMRELGDFDWIETRYEDVVSKLEPEARRMTEFLGLPWNEAQSASHHSARKQFVFAPTYNEVTKPIYNSAVNRWQHYASALAHLEPRLERFFQAFGYSK
jgi:tetratricopeptide (TPR) repeat protein